jgi:hypothetical protein
MFQLEQASFSVSLSRLISLSALAMSASSGQSSLLRVTVLVLPYLWHLVKTHIHHTQVPSWIPSSTLHNDNEDTMIYKRGQTFWYKFNWSIRQRDGTSKSFLVRRSARTKIATEAEEVEHEHRRAIRLGEVHPLDPWPKPPAPGSADVEGIHKPLSRIRQIACEREQLRVLRGSCRTSVGLPRLGKCADFENQC